MSTENNQLVTGSFQYTPFAILPHVLQARDNALATSALIGKVETTAQNEQSALARRGIKALLSLFETQRVKLKTPILEAGRQLDRVIDAEREELKKEDARLEGLEREFIRSELRRRAEEEELQRKELARIEAEKQAELLRIAREQAAAEQKAREAAEAVARAEAARQAEAQRKIREAEDAAARLAAEATNKKQREAAEAARVEAQKKAEIERQASEAAAETARVEAERQRLLAAETARQQSQLALERAAEASYLEAKPPEISRAKGQSVRTDWVIVQINDHILYKSCPDLVTKFQWNMVELKERLTERGGRIPGVTAHEDIKVGQRGGRAPATLDI